MAANERLMLPNRVIARLGVVVLLTLLTSEWASSKRIAPAKVDSIIHDGIRYVAPNDDGRRAYVEAWDVATNKKLWELTLFTNDVDPKVEEDVQWTFIRALNIQDDRLIATSERGETYQIDPKTKQIRQSESRSSPSPSAISDVPETIKNALTNGSSGKKYDFYFQINPAYLHGDFDGDGKIDVAVLVKERSTGKIGVAIVSGTTGKVTVLGAGIGIGNGGDDFEWMDSWQVYSKPCGAHAGSENSTPSFRGDALLVEKSEAASALIYWNGKRYVWFQQGD